MQHSLGVQARAAAGQALRAAHTEAVRRAEAGAARALAALRHPAWTDAVVGAAAAIAAEGATAACARRLVAEVRAPPG